MLIKHYIPDVFTPINNVSKLEAAAKSYAFLQHSEQNFVSTLNPLI